MNALRKPILGTLSLLAVLLAIASTAVADPIQGRDLLKFSQLPMIATTALDPTGVPSTYYGHDELSTLYGFSTNAAVPPSRYQGRFMADDFGDLSNDPVLHVKWWGSYLLNNPNFQVNQFLISFEADQPGGPAPNFSYPIPPIASQVVKKGAIGMGSGTFTETPVPGAIQSVDGQVYEYNAELHLSLPFPEKKDTVYWLKIAAMVDVPATLTFDPFNPQSSPIPMTQWGWHNRDYTVQDTLASNNVPFPGGERNEGPFLGTPVWHYQDDAVTGQATADFNLPGATSISPIVIQPVATFSPTFYVDGVDGFGAVGTMGISHFSKDLAFNLYTINVPEPASCVLFVCGCVGLAMIGRRRRRAG